MTYYLLASTFVFLIGGIIWNAKIVFNLLIKLVLWGLGIYGLILSLQQFGYVLHK